jgi:AraC-like DNA-binding protein
MDSLTALLDAPRARGAFLMRITMAPPWSVHVRDEAPLTVVAVTSGAAWFVPEHGERVRVEAGDVLLCKGPAPYVVADSVDTAPQAIIWPGGRCETPGGDSLDLPLRQGVRTWGNAADGPDTMLIGTYTSVGEVGARILDALPTAVVVPDAERVSPLIAVLAAEIHGEGIGQASLLDRLLDALVVTVVRHWATHPRTEPPAWLRAGGDPLVLTVLDLLHDDPAHPWTVAGLAGRVGLSRAALARRFTDAVGEAPMTYLAGWRLALAADRLRGTDDPVSRISAAVGYASPFTFSAAFKRRYAVSPRAYRRAEPALIPAGPPAAAATARRDRR